MFAGIGGFRAGLDRIGGFRCVGHCEIDKYADASYRAIHDIREEERYYGDSFSPPKRVLLWSETHPKISKEDALMKKIETHPSPEKLLRQVTEEAVNALALGGPDKIGDEAPMEAGVMLIAKAWGLPQESLQASLDLLAKERQLLRSGSGEDALPDSELLEPYDGRMIVELLWGLFETAIKLEDAQDRAAMHKLALLMAESLSLDSWIAECGPSKI